MKSSVWINHKVTRVVSLLLLIAVVTTWLVLTPEGIAGKTGALGYAVCHQIESHTFSIGDKLLPLCARCTGMFLGTLVSLAVLSSKNRAAKWPFKAKFAVLGLMFLFFVVDGVNSTLLIIPGAEPVYPPTNLLRMITGLMMGTILAVILLALWNQTLWTDPNPAPALQTWKQFGFLILAETAAGVLVWMDIPILYYPIAILSTFTIVLILGMVYALLWMILLNKENTLGKIKDGFTFLLFGFATAMIQIGLMDLIRFSIVGTWHGFQF